MKQLVLQLRPDVPPSFANFVGSANAALIRALQDAVAGYAHVYLWGAPGSGRSHLLQATVAAAVAAGRGASCHAATALGDALPDTAGLLLAVDDVEALSESGGSALFNAFNRATAVRQTLVISGSVPPLELAMREDLRTRIGQCLVFEVQALDDETRAALLATLAARRGLRLAPEVVDFLLRHGRRDLGSLTAAIEALDHASLEHKRAATLPLLRELIQTGLEL